MFYNFNKYSSNQKKNPIKSFLPGRITREIVQNLKMPVEKYWKVIVRSSP